MRLYKQLRYCILRSENYIFFIGEKETFAYVYPIYFLFH